MSVEKTNKSHRTGGNTMKISNKTTGSTASSPSMVGGEKMSTDKNRNVKTSVNLGGRSKDFFTTDASKRGFGITTTGGK